MERIPASPTFTDAFTADLGGPRAKAFFAVCEREIPFAELAESVKDVFVQRDAAAAASKGGARSC
jgi:hypothetical protein